MKTELKIYKKDWGDKSDAEYAMDLTLGNTKLTFPLQGLTSQSIAKALKVAVGALESPILPIDYEQTPQSACCEICHTIMMDVHYCKPIA